MSPKRNYRYLVAVTVVYAFLVAAAAGSFTDIVRCSHMLGLTWQAWTVPFLLDGVALMGKLGRSAHFSEATQRAGLRLMLFGGTLSLAANVYAGSNYGQRAFGALLVTGFLIVEWYAGKLAPPVPNVNQLRSEAARRGAATAKANRERKAEQALREQALRDQRNAERREARRVAREVAAMDRQLAEA